VRPLRVVEGKEIVESSETPTVLVVGLEVPFDFAGRLLPSHLAEGILDVMLVEATLKHVSETWSFRLMRVDELRAVICDPFQNRSGSTFSVRTLSSNSTLRLAEFPSVSIILKTRREAWSSTARTCWSRSLQYKSNVDGHTSVLSLKPYPRTPQSLLVRVLTHVFGLRQDGVDAVVVN